MPGYYKKKKKKKKKKSLLWSLKVKKQLLILNFSSLSSIFNLLVDNSAYLIRSAFKFGGEFFLCLTTSLCNICLYFLGFILYQLFDLSTLKILLLPSIFLNDLTSRLCNCHLETKNIYKYFYINLPNILLRGGTRPYKWVTQWDSYKITSLFQNNLHYKYSKWRLP